MPVGNCRNLRANPSWEEGYSMGLRKGMKDGYAKGWDAALLHAMETLGKEIKEKGISYGNPAD